MKENRKDGMALLKTICNDILNDTLRPVSVWSERTYVQWSEDDLYYKSSWGNEEFEKLFDLVFNKLQDYLISKKVDIYFNHIAFEFSLPEIGTIYLGMNDLTLAIGKKIASIGNAKQHKM